MPIATTIRPRPHDLGGGMIVRRLLPYRDRQAVGPFLFFDHFGPVTVRPEDNHDVRPHPHIGLSTITYLFEGAMLHRDSLGYTQRIEPGAINLMTAGRGIVHSERRPGDLATRTYVNHGLQLWTALPLAHEEAEPAFAHTPADAIPVVAFGDSVVRVLIGAAFGATSPVATMQDTLYLDVAAQAGFVLNLDATARELAVFSVDGALVIDGTRVEAHHLAVLERHAPARIETPDGEGRGARYVVLGGEPLDGHRHIRWNFVSSRPERIEQARADWAAQRMGSIPGETEWIPLPA